jgi:hypothetical protein
MKINLQDLHAIGCDGSCSDDKEGNVTDVYDDDDDDDDDDDVIELSQTDIRWKRT